MVLRQSRSVIRPTLSLGNDTGEAAFDKGDQITDEQEQEQEQEILELRA